MSLVTSLILPGIASLITIVYLGFSIYYFDKIKKGNVGVVTPGEASSMMIAGIILLIFMVIYIFLLFFSYITKKPNFLFKGSSNNSAELVNRNGYNQPVKVKEDFVTLQPNEQTGNIEAVVKK